MTISTILSPLELPALARRDLSSTACVVFDILRATTTFVTALQHGAAGIVPVSEIEEAVALRKIQPNLKLAGERDGVRINAKLSGGVEFDFGNSPREFTPEKVRGQTIASTTTNGTRALRACAGAKTVLAAAFLNLAATANFLNRLQPKEILLVCAGTGDGVALEDVLAAGAFVENIQQPTPNNQRPTKDRWQMDDSSQVALQTFLHAKADFAAALAASQNARRLLAIPELHDDVAFCSQRDIFDLMAEMKADGVIRRV